MTTIEFFLAFLCVLVLIFAAIRNDNMYKDVKILKEQVKVLIQIEQTRGVR